MPAVSPDSLPIVLVPGLNCSARLYAEQIPELWRFGPVTVADHTRDAAIAAMASRILAAAPPVFALAGLSLGGYIAFEIMRQAPQRVANLALLDTMAIPETAELTARRQAPMAMARVVYCLWQRFLRFDPEDPIWPTATGSCFPPDTRRCCSTRCFT